MNSTEEYLTLVKAGYTMSSGGNFVEQDPHTMALNQILIQRREQMKKIREKIPVRLESFHELTRELQSLGEGAMSIAHIVNLRKSSDDETFHTWKRSLLTFLTNTQISYSSLSDVWLLPSIAITEIMAAISKIRHVEHSKLRGKQRMECLDLLLTAKYAFDKDIFERVSSDGVLTQEVNQVMDALLSKREFTYLGRRSSENVQKDLYKICLQQSADDDLQGSGQILHHLHDNIANAELIRAEKNCEELSPILPGLKSIRCKIDTDLSLQFPDNPLLNDLLKKVDTLLSHPLSHELRHFRMALESVSHSVKQWNDVAPKQHQLEVNFLISFLRQCYLSDSLKVKNQTIDTILSKNKYCAHLSGVRLIQCLKFILSHKNLGANRGNIALSVLALFVTNGSATFIQEKWECLKESSQKLRESERRNLAAILEVFLRHFRAFEDSLRGLRESSLSEAKSEIQTQAKVMTVQNTNSTVQSYRMARGIQKSASLILAKPLLNPVETDPKDEEDKVPKIWQQEVAKVSQRYLKFCSSDGKDLGSCDQMCERAKKMLEPTSEKIRLLNEEIDFLASDFTEQLEMIESKDKCSKKDRYHMEKMLSGLMNSMQKDGLSYVRGMRMSTCTLSLLCYVNVESRAISQALAQFDLFTRCVQKPQNHVNSHFLAKSRGLVNCALGDLVHLLQVSRTFEEVQRDNCWSIPEKSDKRRQLIKLAVNKLSKFSDDPFISTIVNSFSAIFPTHQVLETVRSNLNKIPVAELKSRLFPNHLEAYKCLVAIKSEISYLLSESAEDMPPKSIISLYQTLLNRSLNLCRVANIALEEFHSSLKDRPREAPTIMEALLRKLQLTDILKLLNVFRKSITMLSYERSYQHFLSEGQPILNLLQKTIGEILQVCLGICRIRALEIADFCKLLRLYITKKYDEGSNEEENSEGAVADGVGEGQGNQDGCGLGQGQGDKATTEGVESEDLFEEESGQQNDETPNDEKRQEDEDFVDFSSDVNADTEEGVDQGSEEETEDTKQVKFNV